VESIPVFTIIFLPLYAKIQEDATVQWQRLQKKKDTSAVCEGGIFPYSALWSSLYANSSMAMSAAAAAIPATGIFPCFAVFSHLPNDRTYDQ